MDSCFTFTTLLCACKYRSSSLTLRLEKILFSRDEATLYEGVSVRPSVCRWVGWSVTGYSFGLLGATNAVYTTIWPCFL